MNYRSITYILGWIMRVEGVFLLLPVIVALIYGEDIWTIYLVCAFLTLAIGVLLSLKRSGNFRLFARGRVCVCRTGMGGDESDQRAPSVDYRGYPPLCGCAV